jgi:hypothetical protein
MSELIWVIPLSIAILILMIILGVTVIGILTGSVGMVEEMMIFFKLINQKKDE